MERLVHGRYLYLDLGLDILDGVTGLHLQGDSLPCQGLHEDLHGRNLDLLQKPHLFSLKNQHISGDKYIQTLKDAWGKIIASIKM